jgi:membrane protease YdiL (CAAX protease family)
MPPAPAWHTAALVALVLAVAVTGTLMSRSGGGGPAPVTNGARVAVYGPMLVVQWSLLGYVAVVGRAGNALPSLLGRGWSGVRRACGDVALALACALTIEAISLAWARVFGASGIAAVSALAPHDAQQRLAWVVVALSVGFCEEVVYRGYLQTQLTVFTGRPALGIALQAALFGVAHADQGLAAVPRVALAGLAFGVLARARRSLWPGIVAHASIDLAGVLLRG